MKHKEYYVYIMANDRPTLYVGMTSDLIHRVQQHKEGTFEGFTKDYSLHKLVYYEIADDPTSAIQREKHLKHWKREWKLRLIKEQNPDMVDLYPGLLGFDPRSGAVEYDLPVKDDTRGGMRHHD